MQVFCRLAHGRGRRVDQPLGDEPRVVLDVLEHRVPAHVLDAAREDHIRRPHRDLAGARGDRRQRACAHTVDGEAGNRPRQSSQQRHVAPECQPLVADLRGGGEDDVVDPLRRQRIVAAQQLADELDGHVIGAGTPEDAFRSGAPEGAADAVDEVDLAELAHRVQG